MIPLEDCKAYLSECQALADESKLSLRRATDGLSALMNRTLQGLNGEERYRVPELVRRALKERGHSRRFWPANMGTFTDRRRS